MKFSEAVELVRTGNFSVTNDEKLDCVQGRHVRRPPDGAAPLNPQARRVERVERELTADEAKRAYVELVLQVTS